MFKRALLISAIATLTVAGIALASAKGHRHAVATTTQLVYISQSSTFPNPGSTSVSSGPSTGAPFGPGAVVQAVKITGHPTPTTYTFKSVGHGYYRTGSATTSGTGTATVHTDGSISVTATAAYTGGTGTYRHAHGKVTVTGSSPPAIPGKPDPLTAKATGKVSY